MSSMSTALHHIGELTTVHADYGTFSDAALIVEGEHIAWIGPQSQVPAADVAIDVAGRAVLPGWVDSHTHLIFAGDRGAEFNARMAGQPYAAGGIATTVAATRAASDEELLAGMRQRLQAAHRHGTTTVEIKTGYGLNTGQEQRLARLAAQVSEEVTFLGAHLVPPDTQRQAYLDEVCGPMLAAVRPYVRWADVFCETGAFDEAESMRILTSAQEAGLGLRVHGNQLGRGPGVQLAVRVGAASVDHCTHLAPEDFAALASSWDGEGLGTVATVLPACDLSTRQPLSPARKLIDAGVEVAIASNCNPGSSYTTSIPFCIATAVLQMGLTIEEAVRAATYGGALALRRASGPGALGSLAPGHRADLQVLDAPSVGHLAYRPGEQLTAAVCRAGQWVVPLV